MPHSLTPRRSWREGGDSTVMTALRRRWPRGQPRMRPASSRPPPRDPVTIGGQHDEPDEQRKQHHVQAAGPSTQANRAEHQDGHGRETGKAAQDRTDDPQDQPAIAPHTRPYASSALSRSGRP